ncbi:hypothetical protein ACTFIR_012586 [Dictyostelium discoideum]
MEINKEQYELLKKLDAVERHKKLIENYLNQKNNKKNQQQTEDKYKNFKTDYQVLKENHQFLRDENENEDIDQLTWEEKLAKTYYDRLYKEYAIIDLSRYKSGEIGLRWRIESEVIMGRGQFTCANKKCESSSSSTTTINNKIDDLKSFEVPFSYNELNENKVALVKVVLCPLCSKLLNYSNIKKKKKELKKILKDEKNKNKNKKRKKNKNDNSEDEDQNEDQEEYEDENDDNKLKKKRKSIENYDEISASQEVVNKKVSKEKDQYEDVFSDMFL